MECEGGASGGSAACLEDRLGGETATIGASKQSGPTPSPLLAGVESTWGVGVWSSVSQGPGSRSGPDVGLLLPTLSERPWTRSLLALLSKILAFLLDSVESDVVTLGLFDWRLVSRAKYE